jgi:DNA mismatch repair protein MutL
MKIIVLPDRLVSQIAAGEVVERPAAVVKELVENSIDAGAREISVWIEGSGLSLIRVVDDGEGMAPEELPLSVERHATSKLRQEVDLFRVATLGFRGEALPSIAAVSRLAITSRRPGDAAACKIRVEGGEKGEVTAAGAPVGTAVEARDLFFNTPARRKFLKSPATELGHICEALNRLALAEHAIHFRLHHGGALVCDYPAVARLDDRVKQVLDREVADAMVPFASEHGTIAVRGFLSVAPVSYGHARYLKSYVNRRFVRDRVVQHALLAGYETLLMKGRYPAAVVYLDLPFEEVDVNVHPAKYEVRFRRQSDVHDAVVSAVRARLQSTAKSSASAQGVLGTGSDAVHELPGVYRGETPRESPPIPSAAPPGDAPLIPGRGFFSQLEVVGQVLGCYLVCASGEGMLVIDQHAAHERIAFERMRRETAAQVIPTQDLLIPQMLDLSMAERALLEERLEQLADSGFVVEPFGPKSYALKSVPTLLPPGDYRAAMRDMLSELIEVGESRKLGAEIAKRLMTIACHSVIRANRRLKMEEIHALLAALDRCDFATQCPHGRPVLVRFSRDEIERMFKRV